MNLPAQPNGCLALEELQAQAADGSIDTVLVGFTDLYGRLVGKRFDASFFLEDTVRNGTHGCDYLLTVDMEMEPVGGYEFANWEQGYGDVHLVPDLGTLRHAAWLDRTADRVQLHHCGGLFTSVLPALPSFAPRGGVRPPRSTRREVPVR